MQIITSTLTSKATAATLIGNKHNTKTVLINNRQRRRSSGYDKKVHYETMTIHNTSKGSTAPAQQKPHMKANTARTQHIRNKEDETIFDITYSTTTEMITPPPSPKSVPSAPLMSQSFEANDRILTAKRQGQLRALMAEYTALKKEGLLFTDHTYNLIFDTFTSLRRDGTPLIPMMKSKFYAD